MKWSLTVGELLEWLGDGATEGNFGGAVTGIADLRTAKAGELTFLSSRKYTRYLAETEASVVIVPADQEGSPKEGQLWIRSGNPSLSLADICQHIERGFKPRPKPGIHPTAIVDTGAIVDESAAIGPYCIVEDGAQIGKDVVLESQVRVDQGAVVGDGSYLSHGVHVGWGCRVGRKCRLFSGVVLGTDGFGYHSDENGHQALPQIGIVVIEDHVDVGANTTIDRARFAETRIGEGTKIDNLVQIGHNVTIGKHCIICAQVGIAGSTELGNFVVLAGQVGIGGHLKIGDGAKATGQTGITGNVESGQVVGGNPSRPHREFLKRQAMVSRLPEMFSRLRALEEGDGKA